MMNKKVVIKYDCGRCGERHDSEDGALECCQPEVETVYLCPICDTEHDRMKDAESCVLGHDELDGVVAECCPNCLRPAESAQLKVEIAVAGHCNTCNPIYTPDQNLKIKYTLEPKGL